MTLRLRVKSEVTCTRMSSAAKKRTFFRLALLSIGEALARMSPTKRRASFMILTWHDTRLK